MSSVVLATAGYDHTIRFWEATSGVCYRTLQFPDSQVNRLEVTGDKTLLAAAGNPHIRLYDVPGGAAQPVHTCDGHTDNVTAIGFHRDHRWMYSGSDDGTVRLWDLRAPGPQRQFESRAAVTSACLHPNQKELVSADASGNVRVWDVGQGACTCELVPEVGVAVRSLSLAADGSLVVAANAHGTCYVWRTGRQTTGGPTDPTGSTSSTATFEPLHKLRAHRAEVLRCLLSPDLRWRVSRGSFPHSRAQQRALQPWQLLEASRPWCLAPVPAILATCRRRNRGFRPLP